MPIVLPRQFKKIIKNQIKIYTREINLGKLIGFHFQMFYFWVIHFKRFTFVAIMLRLLFPMTFLSHCWFYHVYALVLLNNAIYVNLAWNCLTETLAFPSLFSGNIKESHFPFAHLLRHLLLCPGKTFINIHLLSLPAYNIRYPTK